MLLTHQTSLGGALSIIESRNMFRLSPPFSAEFLLVPAETAITPDMRHKIESYHRSPKVTPAAEDFDIEAELAKDDYSLTARPEIHYDSMELTQAFPYEIRVDGLSPERLSALGGFRQIYGFKNIGVILLFRWHGTVGTICTTARDNRDRGDPDHIYHWFLTGYWYSRIDFLRANLLELIGCVVEDPETPGFLEKLSKENGAVTYENPYLHPDKLNRLLGTTRRFIGVRGEQKQPYNSPTDTIGGRDVNRRRRSRFFWSKPTVGSEIGRLHFFASES